MNKKNVKIFTFISLIFITLLIIGGVSAVADENQAIRNDDTIQSDVITTSNDVQDTNEIIKTDKNVKKDSLPADNYEELKDNIDMLSVVWDEESEDPSMSLAEGETFTIDEPIVWGSDSTFTTLTINGNGATIDGSNTYQFITVNEGFTLNLNNLTIQNTQAQKGSGIINYGTLNVNNVTFKDNVAQKTAGLAAGGAIYSEGTTTVEGNSHFINNHITGGKNGDEGAAIYATGALYIKDTEFDANIAEYTDDSSASNGANGGAIAVIDSTSDFIVENATFTNNKGRHGGAILIYDAQGRNQGTKKITGSTFTGNQATYGGAIEVYNDLIIEDSVFEDNSVKGVGSGNRNPLGGAICVNDLVKSGIPGSLTVKNTTFERNTAPIANETGSLRGFGGAIYNSGPDSTIENCTFAENEAYNGGAYYANTNKTVSIDVTIKNSTFKENNAYDGPAIYDYHIQRKDDPSSMTIDDCVFEDNTATNSYGHGIYSMYGGDVTLTNINITDSNKYPIYFTNGTGTVFNIPQYIENVKINGLYIDNIYGGSYDVSVTDYEQLVAAAKQINNDYTGTATVRILFDGTEYIETEPIIFENNTCSVIFVGKEKTIDANGMQFLTVAAGKTLTVQNLTVKNAKADKGAAIVNHGTLTVNNNANFVDNQALYNGGAIYSDGSLTVTKTNFTNNQVTTHQRAGRNDYGGGAICALGKLTVSTSNFTENVAAHNDVEPNGDGGVAGAILVLNNTEAISIQTSNFTANSGRHGGAITINSNDKTNTNKVTIDKNNFVENTALYGGAIDTYQQVNITNNNFTKNTVTGQGSANRVPMGAAICINQGNEEYTVIVKNNNFTENEAKDNGVSGAIHTQDGTTLTSSDNVYQSNKAADTGVVTVFDKATFSNDTFIANSADYTGVFTNYNELTIDNCAFENNEGNGYGDIAYTFNDITITNSIIKTDADTELVRLKESEDYDITLTARDNTVNDVVIAQGLVRTSIDDLEDSEVVSGEATYIVVRAVSDNSIVKKGRIDIEIAEDGTFLSPEYIITDDGFAVIIDTDLIGDKEVNVMYFDDSEEYTYCQKAITLSFKKNPTIEASDITVARKSQELTNVIVKDGETVIQTGTISFEYDNGTVIPTTVTDVSDEGFIIAVPGEIVGTHTVYVIYTADDDSIYSDCETSINLIVTPTVLELGVDEDVNAYVDTDFDLTIDVIGQDEAITGAALQIFVGEEEIDSSRFVYGDAGYLVTLNTDKLGTNTMTIKFTSNNENYTDAEATVTLTLNKVEATISTPERELTATIDEDLSIPVQIIARDEAITQGTISVASQSGLIMQTIPVTEETTTITLPTDVAGTKTYHINYQDDKYTAESIDLTVTTNKISVTINADEEEYYVEYGEDADIIVTIDNDGTPLVQGMLNVYEDGELIKSVDVTDELTTITISYDDVNVHGLTIEYVDDKYTAEDVDVTVIITAKIAEIIADDYDGLVGDNVVITATVECDGTSVNVGTVTFTNAAGEELDSFNLAEGPATLDLGVINEEYSDEIFISYYSDYYTAEDTMISVELLKKFADITLTTGEVSIASPVTITANVEFEDDVINQGQIVFTDDEGNIIDTVDIENNIATTTVTFNDAGIYTVYAEIVDDVYIGDDSVDITVEKIPVTISLSDNQNVAVGSSATITATIKCEAGVVNSGKVIFTKGTSTLGEIEVVENTASIDYTPTSAGESTITAKYIPGDNYSIEEDTATCTITANKIATTTTIDSVTLTSGKTVTLTAHITADDDSIVNGGKVAFKVNGKTLKDSNGKVIYATVVDGVATVEYEVPSTLNGKDISIEAVYSGSTKYVNSKDKIDETTTVLSGTATIEITSQTTFTKGQTATLSAKVTDNNVNINTGKIVFKINGKTLKDADGKVIYATVVDGIASVEYTIPDSMKSKDYILTAVFISSDYDRCEATQSITIQ